MNSSRLNSKYKFAHSFKKCAICSESFGEKEYQILACTHKFHKVINRYIYKFKFFIQIYIYFNQDCVNKKGK